MLWHGRLSIWLVGSSIMLMTAVGSLAIGRTSLAHPGGALQGRAEPPGPTPSTPAELDELLWKRLIEMLCEIMSCQPTDPDGETIQSATACLHVRLDRFEVEGLNPDLDEATVEAWIANIECLIAVLTAPDWTNFVFDEAERDGLCDQLSLLKDALGARLSSARGGQHE